MRRFLFVFDQDGAVSAHVPGDARIDLFPLTGDWRLIDRVRGEFGGRASVLQSARLADEEVDRLRRIVGDWAARLGNRPVGGKSLKEWFLLPGGRVSSWWFSFFSEKNNLKTDAFFRVAQLQALDRLFQAGTYNECFLRIEDNLFRRTVERLSRRHKIKVRRVCGQATPPVFERRKARSWLDRLGFAGNKIHALIKFAAYGRDAWLARRTMGGLSNRPLPVRSLLFVSYFPSVDREAAGRGEFRNRFAGPLQDMLVGIGRSVTWLLLFAPLDGWSYREALRLGRRLADRGEPVFFLQEFMSLGVYLRVLAAWLIQLAKYVVLAFRAKPGLLVEGFAVPEAGDLLRPLWRQSFVGWTGLSGILYYELFRKAFSHFRNAADCLYFLEMHAWEKALNAAKGTQNPGMRTIGFQHAAVSRNHFFYIHNAAETKRTGQAADLPLPDVFACNGQRPCDTFSRQGHPDVRPVEAVRELHLIPIVKHGFRPKAAPPVLLLVGSLDRWETQSMILLLHAAFPRREGFRIWLRGHPMFPSQRAFEGLELNPAEWGCELKEDPVHDLLAVATIVMGGESSVNLEALAYGCQVVAPVLNNAMFMSPLGGSEEFYHRVCDPEELRRAVKDILAGRSSRKSLQEARRLVEEHWNLDESLARWRELLSLKGEPSGRTGQAVSV